MRKAKIFYGEPESGKTRKAREIAEGRNFLHIDASNGKINLKRVTKETELIIIDDLPDGFNFESVYDIFTYDMPDIIFITNEKPKYSGLASFDRRFELIEFKK
jgi:hypothetical protein